MTNPQEHKQQVDFWLKKKNRLLQEAESVQKIINDLQALCDHKYANGRSAIEEDAPLHPASQLQCQICGKYFN